jgi:hypothetical protein
VRRGDEEIRARKHPLAVLGVWAWETAFASIASWPAVSLIRAAYGSDPRGDAALWTPGAHALLDFLWRDMHGVSAAAWGAALVLAVGAVTGLVPMAVLMVAMSDVGRAPEGAFASNVADAVRALPAMALLLVVVTATEALVLGAGAFVGELAEGWTHASMGEALAQQLGAALAVPFLVLSIAIGIMHDLARAAVVRRAAGCAGALVAGVAALRADPVSLGWSWAWRAMASLVPMILVGAVADRLGGRGGAALVLLALLHQGVVLGRIALRASWLATGLRRLSPPHLDASVR